VESPPRLARIGLVARFKPVHLGHLAVLEGALERAERVVIGLGSANRHDLDNPWSAAESAAMIRAALGPAAGRATLVELEDLGDGPRWATLVVERLGALDLFVTANAYVAQLLERRYRVAPMVSLVSPGRRVRVEGRQVRAAMARGGDWRALVPAPVAELLCREGLVDRFRREFGLATLARDAPAPEPRTGVE
jgi:cytidyltransferase-like protein